MSHLLLSCAATGNCNCWACMVLFPRRAMLLAICGGLMLLKGCGVLGFRVSLISGPGSPVAWASFRTQVLTSGVLACLLQGKMYPDLSHFLQRSRSGSFCGWLSLEIMWPSSMVQNRTVQRFVTVNEYHCFLTVHIEENVMDNSLYNKVIFYVLWYIFISVTTVVLLKIIY